MIKQFSYNASHIGAEAIDIVEGSLALARQVYDKNKDSDYNEKNAFLCNCIAKFAISDTKFANEIAALKEEEQGEAARKLFSRAAVRNNTSVRDNFNLILTQIVTAIVPEVSNDIFSRFIAEVHQVGFGDTAVFKIESNDLFAVKEKAEGVRRGVDQPMFDDEFTVNAHPVSIDTHIDWYPFVSGRFDMGNFALKIARSFAAYIFIKSIKGLTAAKAEFGAAYTINGVSANLWTDLIEKLQAANGGMGVIAVGTKAALAHCTLNGNFQVEIGEEMNKVGYLDQYLGTPLVAINNVLVPGTTNSTAELVLPNDEIYLVPVAGDKPVKVVFEGNEVSVNYDPEHTSDVRYGISVEMRLGVAAICGSKYGLVVL